MLRNKFNLSQGELAEAKERIESIAWGVTRPNERIREVPEDPDDDRVLECAVPWADAVIVAGDKHLLALRQFRHVQIVTVSRFIDWPGLPR